MTAPRRRPKAEPRSASRRTAEQADLKQSLLTAAKQLFGTLGYQATPPERIAEAAGVTEAVLARHFNGKSWLLQAILEEVRSATLVRWQTEIAGVADPLARLHALVDLLLASTRDLSLELRILQRAIVEDPDKDILALFGAVALEWEGLLAGIIAEGQQAGVFRRNLDPRIGAWQLIRTALGCYLTRPLNVPLHAEPDHLHRTVECLLHCLLKTDV
jgi:AcrR family transcriptional regulator